MNISHSTVVLSTELLEEKTVPMGPCENTNQPDEVPVVGGYADDEDEDDVDDLDDDEDQEEDDDEVLGDEGLDHEWEEVDDDVDDDDEEDVDEDNDEEQDEE